MSHEQLIARIWNGRAVSENSVAVAIGQLRRALDDDARDPTLIETIPKRGYRLADNAGPPPRRQALKRLLLLALALGALVAGVLAIARTMARPEIGMSDVVNATGDRRYDPLARATSELMLAELSARGFDVERGGHGGMAIASKLVMWNGEPYLGLSATDAKGVVRWSAMTKGTPEAVPPGLHDKLDQFQRVVKP